MKNGQLAMQSVKKHTPPDLSIGSTFFLSVNSDHYPAKIKVLSRKEEKVEIEISMPVQPETCNQCGHGRNLSVNGITGVVVCMTTGCGQDFGYQSVETATVNASDLTTLR